MGKARAKQMEMLDEIQNQDSPCELGDKVLCIQMHGDAAFTGQGVVMECFGLSNLPHFTSGGSIHIVVNNQIGYTTPAMNSRSSVYASDIGKIINAPVIHVNGDFPEVGVEVESDKLIRRLTCRKLHTPHPSHLNIETNFVVTSFWMSSPTVDGATMNWTSLLLPSRSCTKSSEVIRQCPRCTNSN